MNSYLLAAIFFIVGVILFGLGILFNDGLIFFGIIFVLLAIRIMKFVDTYRIVSDRKKNKTKR